MIPTLSLITGTRNRQASFDRLLASIEFSAISDWELIVSDASDEALDCDHTRVQVLAERPRLGCTRGYNRAFQAARGRWVIWLNDDAEVLPGFDSAAIDFMSQNPEIGLGCLRYREMFYRDPHRKFSVNSYFGMMYANFGILNREFGNHIGWFDEDLPMYGNDNSLAFRTLLAGNGIAEIPHDSIIHHCEQDIERRANDVHDVRIEAVRTLIRKYGPRMDQMQDTYRRRGGFSIGKDQTPGWALREVRELAQ
jgi:GT2 family glycosyltransferase